MFIVSKLTQHNYSVKINVDQIQFSMGRQARITFMQLLPKEEYISLLIMVVDLIKIGDYLMVNQ